MDSKMKLMGCLRKDQVGTKKTASIMEADSAFLGCIIAVECRLAVQGLNKLAIVRRTPHRAEGSPESTYP
jgi:hypothetical protein